MDTAVVLVAIEGGPCAGKTEIKNKLVKRLWTDCDILAFATPEAATETMQMGFDPTKNTVVAEQFQKLLLRRMRDNESYCTLLAKSYIPSRPLVVIFCDRGIPGISGYIGSEKYHALLAEHWLCPISMRDSQYHCVLHLRTTAYGAEEHYSNANNDKRVESICEARARDDETILAWLGHPKMRIIPNRPKKTWEDKCDEVWRALLHMLGIPEPLEIERKFLVDSSKLDLSQLPVHSTPVRVEQRYLTDGSRIRRRGIHGRWAYTKTRKSRHPGSGVAKEKERAISLKKFTSLLADHDPRTQPLCKMRHYFIWEDQVFELDVFDKPEGLVLLELELIDEHDCIILPPFIPIIRDVTDEKEYKNHRISKNI